MRTDEYCQTGRVFRPAAETPHCLTTPGNVPCISRTRAFACQHLANQVSATSIVAVNLHNIGQLSLPCTSTLVTTNPPALSTPPSPEAYVAALPDKPSYDDRFLSSIVPTAGPDVPRIQSDQGPEPASATIDDHLAESHCSTLVNVTDPLGGSVQKEMKNVKTKATIGFLATIISYMSLNSLYRALDPEAFIWYEEDREERSWIATSKYWLDRKACRWLGTCGAAHFAWVRPRRGSQKDMGHDLYTIGLEEDGRWQHAWTEGKDNPDDWSDDERVLREIPDYVIEYAPLVHLFSGEQFWPCDIAEHLTHVDPFLNYTPMKAEHRNPTLETLQKLNEFEHGRNIFLTSKDDPEALPEWLEGEKNIPSSPPDSGWQDSLGEHFPGSSFFYRDHSLDHDETKKEWSRASDDGDEEAGRSPKTSGLHGRYQQAIQSELRRRAVASPQAQKIQGGRSDAPAVLVVVDKGHGIVDAFWFFFYSFNLGNVVFNVRFGNHVGDWEHTAIRFHNGVPKAVFFSEHNFGSAYSYGAVEKIGKRPIIYSATGTHAMYATAGRHPYVLPWGILHDETDKGPLWDPALNSHAYTYDHKNDTLRSSTLTPKAPTGWFFFAGHWGDKFYPLADKRQYRFAGQYHYVNGPLGPRFKNLGRKHICGSPDNEPCVIKNWLGGSARLERFKSPGEGDELTAEQEQHFFGHDEELTALK